MTSKALPRGVSVDDKGECWVECPACGANVGVGSREAMEMDSMSFAGTCGCGCDIDGDADGIWGFSCCGKPDGESRVADGEKRGMGFCAKDSCQAMALAEIEAVVAAERGCDMPPDAVAALTIWGEARGEGKEGMAAVASVIQKRAMRMVAFRDTPLPLAISSVCLARHQFSCWKDGKFNQPEPHECKEWDECHRVAMELVSGEFSPTIDATHYHADHMVPPPEWADKIEMVGKVGHHVFYLEW